jgi:hypothetical protein
MRGHHLTRNPDNAQAGTCVPVKARGLEKGHDLMDQRSLSPFRADITAAAYLQIAALVPDDGLARWAAQLAPAVAIEAVIAWLDAGQPAAARVRQAVMSVIGAATAADADCSFPRPANMEGPAS